MAMPYLWGQAIATRESGVPMLRAMMLEFPNDPACDTLDRQYLLGESLLVAPVFSASNCVDYYVPAGPWTHFLSGQTVEGPGWSRETHDFHSLPLMVRPNSIVAVGDNDQRPDYDYAQGVTLRVYELEDGARCSTTVYDLSGTAAFSATASRTANRVRVEVTAHADAKPDWRAQYFGGDKSEVATPETGDNFVEITLH